MGLCQIFYSCILLSVIPSVSIKLSDEVYNNISLAVIFRPFLLISAVLSKNISVKFCLVCLQIKFARALKLQSENQSRFSGKISKIMLKMEYNDYN